MVEWQISQCMKANLGKMYLLELWISQWTDLKISSTAPSWEFLSCVNSGLFPHHHPTQLLVLVHNVQTAFLSHN